MFFVIKRKGILLILVAAVLVSGITALFVTSARRDTPVFAVPTANRVIVVDAGHGGMVLTQVA